MTARRTVLVIAGSDPSGGAGAARDLRTLADFGLDALCVVTAVTAQSHTDFRSMYCLPAPVVCDQLRAALETTAPQAIKIGMLGSRAIVETVAECLPERERVPIVLDPVLVSSSGGVLLELDGLEALRKLLIPQVTLLTPNIPEASALLGDALPEDREATYVEYARRLLALGPHAVLLKGGHASGATAVDWLLMDNEMQRLPAPRLNLQLRGTGCALSTAIAARLASGDTLAGACGSAKCYVHELFTAAAEAPATPERHPR